MAEASTPELQLRNNAPEPTHDLQQNDVGKPTPVVVYQNLLGDYLPTELEKRGLIGPGGILPGKVLPSILGNLSPNVVSVITQLAAAPLSTLIPAIPNIPNILPTLAPDAAVGGAGIPLLPGLGGAIPLNPAGLTTVADDASDWMAAGISGLFRGATALLPGNLPLATVVDDIVAQATKAADEVLSQVQHVAEEVATLAAQVESDVLSPDGALLGAGSLLDNLESTVDDIVNHAVAGVADVVPVDLLDNIKSLVANGVSSILDAPNGAVALVATLLDEVLCEAVRLVDGILVTVTGVCGDMASVAGTSPTYANSATATGSGSLNPSFTSVGPSSASAAQSMTMPSATGSGAGQTGQVTKSGIQGSASGGNRPTQSSNGISQTTLRGQNTASNSNPGAGSRVSSPLGSNGVPQVSSSRANGSATFQTTPNSGSGSGSSPNAGGQSSPDNNNGASQTAPAGVNGQSSPNGGTGGLQTTPVGSSGGSPSATPIISGEPIPLPPEGTGPNGSWTGGGNMPSRTGQPNGGSGTAPSGALGSGGVSAVTVSVMVTTPVTVLNGAGSTPTVYVPGTVATTTSIVSIVAPCPAQPPCPTCPPSLPSGGSRPGQGPCPGTGYTCDDCIDGWFCPPPQTPAQSGPNGCFGWPCAHCSNGWFCIAKPDTATCTSPEASTRRPNPGGPMSPAPPIQVSPITTIPFFPTPTGPLSVNTVAPRPANAAPSIKDPANGWSYSGYWADQPLFAVLDFTPETSFGPVENDKCVRHCIVNGYTIAATSFGYKCFCGMFLNGTQKLEDASCMTPCDGDSSQACGSDWSLLTYTPDGVARGWAPIGEQPNPSPRPAPTIIELVYGGVEQSVVTQNVVMGPTSGVNIASLISSYGERNVQPQASLPSGVGPQTQCTTIPSGLNGASLTAPGSGKGPTSPVNGGATPTLPGGGNPNTSPSSPRGGGGVAPGQQSPTNPGGSGPTTSFPGSQLASTPAGNDPSPTGPGIGNPKTTPNISIGPSTPGGNGGSPSKTYPDGGTSPSTSATLPSNGGGVTPGQPTPTSPGGIGPGLTLPGGSNSNNPSSPNGPGGQGGSTPSGGNSTPTGPIGLLPTCIPGAPTINCVVPPDINGTPTGPGGQSLPTCAPGAPIVNCIPPGSNGGTPSGPGTQPPICTPGALSVNCIAPAGSNSTPTGPGGHPPQTCAPGGPVINCVPVPRGDGGTPTGPGNNGGNSSPSGGQLPTCSPGLSGINCVPALPQGAGISPTPSGSPSMPPSGVPGAPAPSQPINISQGTISLPGVAAPTGPGVSVTQSSSKQASLTAPGKQTPSTLSSATPTSPGGSSNPGGNNPAIPTFPIPSDSPTPGSPGGTNPGTPGQATNQGPSVPSPTANPTGPSGIGPGTTGMPNTIPNGGSGTLSGPNQPSPRPSSSGGISSYNWPPGMVPYGDHPPFTTLAHMLSWKAPDGSTGPATLEKRVVSENAENVATNQEAIREQAMATIRKSQGRWSRRRDSL